MNPAAISPTVFISYSHDSKTHESRVKALADLLVTEGVQVVLDKYQPPGGPPEGWPTWMENAIEEADKVLVVCTETYFRRYKKKEAARTGKGGTWEGAILKQNLYDAQDRSDKFAALIFDPKDEDFIPPVLRERTWYLPVDKRGYEHLYCFLTKQEIYEQPTPGNMRIIPPEPIQAYWPSQLEQCHATPISQMTAQPEAPLSLEEAFDRIISCVCLVIDKKFSKPLGWAWFNEGRQFLCDIETARLTKDSLPGSDLNLLWCGGAKRLSSLIIESIQCPQKWDVLGRLYVYLSGKFPNSPRLADTPEFFHENELGTILIDTITRASELIGSDELQSEIVRVELGCVTVVPHQITVKEWRRPILIGNNFQRAEILLPGAPLFDAQGRMAGCVTRNASGAFVALPIDVLKRGLVH